MSDAIDLMSFESFWARAGDAIGVSPEGIEPATRLSSDLELDSLHVVELIVFLEEEMGCDVLEDLVPVLITADDVYSHYVTRITNTGSRR
jgi:acyl carrier protein